MLNRIRVITLVYLVYWLLPQNGFSANEPAIKIQASSISGKVSDYNKKRSQLLPGVKAYIFKDSLLIDSTTVSTDGSYSFEGLSEGKYDIVIRGSEYFPIKILGVKVENGKGVKLPQESRLIVLTEKYKPEHISYRLVNAILKSEVSEAELENKITGHYRYEIDVMKSIRGDLKFLHLTLRDGSDALICSILIPEGENATSVSNVLIMDPYVIKMEAVAGIRPTNIN